MGQEENKSGYFKGLSRQDYIKKAHEIIKKEVKQFLSAGLQRSLDVLRQVCTDISRIGKNSYIMQSCVH